jgi:SNF2 family DNA or RNA helicase
MAQPELKPTSSKRQYKPHQVDGIQWMIRRESSPQPGGLLCDDMGLGKTEQILGLITNTPLLSTLLLCPKALIPQWRKEFQRCGFAVRVIIKGKWVQVSTASTVRLVYLTNYDSLIGKPHLFQRYDRVCLDEAHQGLCKRGKLYGRVASIKRKSTWVITATPVVNSFKDTQNLLSLVGYTSKDLDALPLEHFVTEAVLHRSMNELRTSLPNLPVAAKETTISLTFASEEECEFYQGVQGKLVKRWKSLDKDATPLKLQLLMKLRQLSIHPQVYIGARKREPFGYSRDCWTGTSTKFSAMEKLLADEVKPKRWIIFCQFKDEMNLIENELMDKYTVLQYHGGLSEEQKATVLKESEGDLGGKHMVFLVNIKSGGVGLNLQHFTHIIFMSPWWTSALMRQSIGRAVRIGQKEEVQVYHLVLKEEETLNIDALMREKVADKEEMLVDLLARASRGNLSTDIPLNTEVKNP